MGSPSPRSTCEMASMILWGAFIRSGMVLGGNCVLMDEAAEPVVPTDRGCWRRRKGSR
jgi:hypothetical protein